MPLACVALLLVGGCAGYVPRPLPEAPQWSSDSESTSAPLTVDQVVSRALEFSPEVRRAERDVDIAKAKSYADGLLPDPTLNFSTDRPGAAGYVPAFMVELGYEVSALVDRPAKKRAANAFLDGKRLALEWTRWQVANQAYALYVQNVSLTSLEDETSQRTAHQRDVANRMDIALEHAYVTRDAAMLAQTRYRDSELALSALRQEHLKAMQELNTLLGIRPGTRLALAAPPEPTDIPQDVIAQALADLAKHRPDLLALRAGYDEQDERYRAALLGQFPKLDIGVTRGRDTSAIYTTGLSVSVTLPLFNGNRGNIAIEKATRESLYDDYVQRLDDAYSAVDGITAELGVLQGQLHTSRASEYALKTSLEKARHAFEQGNLALPAFADIESQYLAQRIASEKLEGQVLQQHVALCTLIGVSAIDDEPLPQARP
ncbi:TolC family protein [Paraburkholderia bengalensis]|uniref:TolC family protein n=1 Tax=Paraburkholderia bengalensis TaxID=2747562 RepID=A0ABU8IWF8_9BURK